MKTKLTATSHASHVAARRTAKACHRMAFTLIELLTVIAIIGILAAILIPVVGKVRQSARQAQCVSRMRDLGSAFTLFANENKGRLPYSSVDYPRWWKQLAIYVSPMLGEARAAASNSAQRTQIDNQIADSGLFRCPTVEAETKGSGTTNGIFLYNNYLDNTGLKYAPVYMERISNPSSLPVLSTAAANSGYQLMFNASGGFGPHPKAKEFGYTGDTNDAGPSPNFGNRAVFLFADWHVRAANVCNSDTWPWKDTSIFLPW